MDLRPLNDRDGLPDSLRLLLAEFPRAGWEAHPNFGGLVQFWLERHLEFRDLVARLGADAEALLDRRIGAESHGRNLVRHGSALLEHLHGHHQIEDRHYFPLLAGLEPRLATGFDLLEADHVALDPALAGFAEAANAVLRAGADDAAARAAGPALAGQIAALTRLLDRHLVDEEELVVPVVLKTGIG